MTPSNTLIGALPDDWSVQPLGDLFTVSAGGDWDPQNCVKVRDSSHPYAVVANALTPGATHGYCSYYTVPGDTLTITGRGDVGHAVYRPKPFVPIVRLLALVPKQDLSSRFYAEYINARVNFSLESTGVPQLTAPQVRPYLLAFPPAEEQRAIARVLEATDDLIAALERMITKKQAIKKGMMQQKFALPADGSERDSLGSVTSFISGGTPDRANAEHWSGNIPWISATTLKRVEVSTSDQLVTARAVRAGSRMAPLNSTLMLVRGSALHSEIRASLVTAPVCFNQDVKALVPAPRIAPKFLTYSIHANADRLLRLVTSAGNTAGVLDTRVLKEFEIWLPDRDTQDRVVSVFDDVVRELDVLASKLMKAREVKHGMMQELLTGRTRLPVKEAAA